MKKIILGLIFTLITVNAYAQSSAVVQGKTATQRSYVKVLEVKVGDLNAVISDLNEKISIFSSRLLAAEAENKAFNACAGRTPPMLYAGRAHGCVDIKPAPCELCNPTTPIQ